MSRLTQKLATRPTQRMPEITAADMWDDRHSRTWDDFNRSHPELGQGEAFLCNIEKGEVAGLNLKTARLGEQCYSVDGKKFPSSDSFRNFRPLFAQRTELDALLEAEEKGEIA